MDRAVFPPVLLQATYKRYLDARLTGSLMDLNTYKLNVKPDQSLIEQQKTRVLTRPCLDKSNVLLLLNEQGQTP